MRRFFYSVIFLTVCSCGFNNRNKQDQTEQVVTVDTLTVDPITVKDTVPAKSETLPKMLNPEDLLKEGEDTVGNFRIKYSFYLNEIIVDTIFISPTEVYRVENEIYNEVYRNRSLFLSVHYNDELIVDNTEIRSTSFDGIFNPKQFVLAPMCGIDIKSANDTLIVNTGMSVEDTDWGFWLDIKISKYGDISLSSVSYDETYEDY